MTGAVSGAAYAELHCRSYFSFLDGATPPEELVERAAALGYRAIAITDVDGVHGLPRAHGAARQLGVTLIVGAEVSVAETEDEAKAAKTHGRLVLLALDGKGYARLCRILTTGRLRHEKGSACVTWDEIAQDPRGLAALTGGAGGPVDRALARRDLAAARAWTARVGEAFGDRGFVELTHHLRPGDDERIEALGRLAHEQKIARIVTQDARYAKATERPIHDVLTCVRHKTTLAKAGRRLAANGESHLRELPEIARRFAGYPDAIERTAELAARVRFSLDELRYRFPAFPIPTGETPFSHLYELAHRGARTRYRPITARVAAQLAHELGVIERMKLAGYFLIVWDIVRFCNEQGILCQGRGSAANSAVCYALGITAVDPVGMELLFERFLSEDRTEMPDIDLDIAHQRREEVIQYVYDRYGRDRVAMANEVITYRMRSAIRDVGKAFGLSLAQVDAAAKAHDAFVSDGRVDTPYSARPQPRIEATLERGAAERPVAPRRRERAVVDLREINSTTAAKLAGLDPTDQTVARVIAMSRAIAGFPRHLGIHSGGMVIADGPIGEVVPIENASMEKRTVTQWDKDDLNQLGIIKIDLLGLGMLTVIDGALALVERHERKKIDLHALTPDDPQVYDLICRADTIGVFQIESRAQMSMLPRLRPRTFYDLVIEVAIIRPGPIQGDMVHPYLLRREGKEAITYAHPSLEPVLARTLGVPLFQEQGMKLAIVAAGFTPGEADELRRAMGHKRSHERMAALEARLERGMAKNGIPKEAAERVFKQLSAFADYGFPESHSASFALLVYASAYLKRHHPAAFAAALLNAQPMGFYSPATIVSDAQRHGVTVLPACARRSAWFATLEPTISPGAARSPVSKARGGSGLMSHDRRAAHETGPAPSLAVRLGITSVRGVGEAVQPVFEAARAAAPFRSVGDFARRSGLPRVSLERLAAADGFAGFGLRRREALWQIAALPRSPAHAPLLADVEFTTMTHEHAPHGAREIALPPMTAREQLTADYVGLGLSIDQHPIALARAALDVAGVRRAADLGRARQGDRVSVAGLVIIRQRPPTAKGMVFITLEDETGLANLVITPPVYDRLRPLARDELLIVAHGKIERSGTVGPAVVNLKVEDLTRLDEPIRSVTSLTNRSRDFR